MSESVIIDERYLSRITVIIRDFEKEWKVFGTGVYFSGEGINENLHLQKICGMVNAKDKGGISL